MSGDTKLRKRDKWFGSFTACILLVKIKGMSNWKVAIKMKKVSSARTKYGSITESFGSFTTSDWTIWISHFFEVPQHEFSVKFALISTHWGEASSAGELNKTRGATPDLGKMIGDSKIGASKTPDTGMYSEDFGKNKPFSPTLEFKINSSLSTLRDFGKEYEISHRLDVLIGEWSTQFDKPRTFLVFRGDGQFKLDGTERGDFFRMLKSKGTSLDPYAEVS